MKTYRSSLADASSSFVASVMPPKWINDPIDIIAPSKGRPFVKPPPANATKSASPVASTKTDASIASRPDFDSITTASIGVGVPADPPPRGPPIVPTAKVW